MDNRTGMDYFINLGLAAIAGLSGCAAIIVLMVGVAFGIWLDARVFDSTPLFTILCIVVSVPVSLVTMLVIAIRSAKTIEKRQYGNQ
jgi:F0F1-type ATP synthase assembly protein I